MHRFSISPSQLSHATVTFTGAQSHQLRNVLRLRPGDHVRVFDGVLDRDLVVELVGPSEARVVGETPHAPEPWTRLAAYPALLQRDKFEPVLQKLTEVGASSITPVLSARGLVREGPDERRLVRWRAILTEAAEQSGRGRVPGLCPAQPLLEALRSAPGLKLLAYEGERKNALRDALAAEPIRSRLDTERAEPIRSRLHTERAAGTELPRREVSLFVGPEGGFSEEEVRCAREHGAQVITLGPRILRTETASPVLAALVLYELGDLSWPA